MHMMEKRDAERRLGMDRRCFSYDGCIPERRSGRDRRFKGSHQPGKVIGLDISRKDVKKPMSQVY